MSSLNAPIVLRVRRGDESWVVRRAMPLSLGRAGRSEPGGSVLNLSQSPAIARVHATIERYGDDRLRVSDTSINGTRVGVLHLQNARARLEAGAPIVIGPYTIEVLTSGSEQPLDPNDEPDGF